MTKIIFLIIFFLFTCGVALAEDDQHEPTYLWKKEQTKVQLHDRWSHLIPRQNKLQFAGSMGMLSGSVGWYYGKKNQWETDLFLGFIPKLNRQESHVTITLKQTYTPWQFKLNDDFKYEPLTTGLYINKIFGEYFWNNLPEKYPNGYYFWAVNTRFNIFIGQAITAKLNKSQVSRKELSFYYELSTNDLYIISAIGNRTISVFDIIGLSLGIRYRVF